MASQSNGVVVEGLTEFRSALRSAAARYPTELPRALKAAGVPVVAQAAAISPKLTGALSRGYSISVRGTTANVVSSVPYSGGAEWGTRGKWAGFTKYGAVPRIAGRAVQEQEPTIALIVQTELADIVTAYGWFV